MLQQDSLEFLALELELPREKTGRDDHWRRNCGHDKVVIGGRGEGVALRQLRDEVKRNAREKQGDREVNQHDVLRVFGQQRFANTEWVHSWQPSLHDDLAESFSDGPEQKMIFVGARFGNVKENFSSVSRAFDLNW